MSDGRDDDRPESDRRRQRQILAMGEVEDPAALDHPGKQLRRSSNGPTILSNISSRHAVGLMVKAASLVYRAADGASWLDHTRQASRARVDPGRRSGEARAARSGRTKDQSWPRRNARPP